MNKLFRRGATVAFAVSAALGACSKSKPEAPAFAQADVQFMQGMIGHHAQAIVMAAMATTHGASKQVLTLGKRIDISQRDEITMMEQWLKERNQPVPDSASHMSMPMAPGMLSPAELKQLDQARDAEFDRLFLTFMIHHHEGALAMVKTLFGGPDGGQSPEMFRYASDVSADQSAEIDRMQRMLSLPHKRER